MSAIKSTGTVDQDINIVGMWTSFDKVRWIAGALGGLFAGFVAIVFAMVMVAAAGSEFWYPVKLMATPVLGAGATVYGFNLGAIVVGLIVFEVLTMVLGMIYAHFTVTNLLSVLLGIGIVWALFSWIFIWNLFLQSFETIFASQLPSGAALAVCLVFGLSLTSVGAFDRALRRR